MLFFIVKGENIFLQLKLKLWTAIERADRLYVENQVMKRRLLKYEKPSRLYYYNKKGLNESTGI